MLSTGRRALAVRETATETKQGRGGDRPDSVTVPTRRAKGEGLGSTYTHVGGREVRGLMALVPGAHTSQGMTAAATATQTRVRGRDPQHTTRTHTLPAVRAIAQALPQRGSEGSEKSRSMRTRSRSVTYCVPQSAHEVHTTGLGVHQRQQSQAESCSTRRGLVNLGNACYMNACIQALASVPELHHGLVHALRQYESRKVQSVPTSVVAPWTKGLCSVQRAWPRVTQSCAPHRHHRRHPEVEIVPA
jgi:hypothetical protein